MTDFSSVNIAGVPLIPGAGDGTIPPTTGQVLYVSNVTGDGGAAGNPGTAELPINTIDAAIGKCVANAGDVILVMSGHAETLSAASAITCDVAGVSIVGLGSGADRPELTFGTAVGASVVVSAANVTIRNIVGIANIDALTNPFHVQAAGCVLDIEWQDGSATVEAARAILGTAAADNLTVDLRYQGFIAGDACVNAVRLVGTVGGRVKVDFYGKASTSIVEFVTTACHDIVVSGYMYNSGTTDGSKDVIDTVTGSTWFADFYDGAAGAQFSGGSAAALASDDISTVNAKLGTIVNAGGTATLGAILGDFANTTLIQKLNVPALDAAANVSVTEVVGNKTDASVYVPGTTKSLAAYLKGAADLQERVAVKAAATIVNAQTLFTVAGGPIKIEALWSECVTANDATASTLQYSATPTVGAATTISGASASLANAAAGASVALAGTALATAALLAANGPNLIANPGTVVVPAGTITAVVGVGSTTGTWRHYIRYRPLAVGVTVV